MGLFVTSKNPCPICGTDAPQIFSTKIEGKPICNDCALRIDMDQNLRAELTIEKLREHFSYLDKNQTLQEQFGIDKKFCHGLFSTIIFDYDNRLFCMNGQPNRTIFQGHELASVEIKEDHSPLIKVCTNGLKRYPSRIPDMVAALKPKIDMMMMADWIEQRLSLDDDKPTYRPHFDLPEPFERYNIEIRMEHPYWKQIKFDYPAPSFNNHRPDCNAYMKSYFDSTKEMEELADAFRKVAFLDKV